MQIGLYFGSFNPIHVGHLIIASYAASNTSLDQIWLVVSPHNPFKKSKELLNEYHRLHLVQLAIEEDVLLRASDIEFRLPRPSYTIDTLAYLEERFSQHSFSLLIGSDSYTNLPKWKNGDLIIQNYDVYVYKRRGFEPANILSPRIHFLEAPLLDISATLIRNSIKEGKSIRYLVPEKVQKEIEINNYYKF